MPDLKDPFLLKSCPSQCWAFLPYSTSQYPTLLVTMESQKIVKSGPTLL